MGQLGEVFARLLLAAAVACAAFLPPWTVFVYLARPGPAVRFVVVAAALPLLTALLFRLLYEREQRTHLMGRRTGRGVRTTLCEPIHRSTITGPRV